MITFGNDWDELLREEFQKPYYQELRKFLRWEYAHGTVYPDMYDIFNAFKWTPYRDVKAVLLGQDPYHGRGQAHGLCFSVQRGVTPPPSLRNIFTELRDDLGITPPDHGELTQWAKQGVLMLNTVLTVRAGQPNSHRGKGWEIFTDRVISLLNQRETPIVFLLWGANAKAKRELITNSIHHILTAAHPSPYSASSGFFGCRHFSKTNALLAASGQHPIDWTIL